VPGDNAAVDGTGKTAKSCFGGGGRSRRRCAAVKIMGNGAGAHAS